MASSRTLVLLSSSLLLFFLTILYFSSSSPPPPFLSKALSFLHPHNDHHDYNTDHRVFTVSFDQEDTFREVENSTPAVGEEDVVVLTGANFTRFVSANKFVMVNFYAPWCYWSQRLAPEYAAAATLLKGEAVLAKVDASVHTELGRKFMVNGYPTLFLLVGGGALKVAYDPSANRTRDAIANWVKLKIKPQVQTVTTPHEVEDILATKPTILLAFLNTLEDPVTKELDTVSKLHVDVDFYQTTNVDVARSFHICPHTKRPALIMLKREDGRNHTHFVFDGEFTESTISDFVFLYKLPSVITFTEENAPLIYKNPMKQLWLFAPKFSPEATCAFKQAAEAFRGKLLFVHFHEYKRQVKPRVVAYMSNGKKHAYSGDTTLSGIKSFAKNFLEEKPFSQLSDPDSNTVLELPKHARTFGPTSRPLV